MRALRRLAIAAALSAFPLTAIACAGSRTPAPAPTAAAPTSVAGSASRMDGVTTTANTFGPARGQLPQGDAPGLLNAVGPQLVASAASTNALPSTLVSAVKAAGLVQTLNQQQAITVFAPYDGAFDEVKKSLGEQKFNALPRNKDSLGQVVATRYDHAAVGEVMPLVGGASQVKDTDSGMTVTDGAANSANVLCGNIPTANATVFVLDKVLMQSPTPTDLAVRNQDPGRHIHRAITTLNLGYSWECGSGLGSIDGKCL